MVVVRNLYVIKFTIFLLLHDYFLKSYLFFSTIKSYTITKLVVAKEFYNEYFNCYGQKMDEMKMHKLMYFAQRESLMLSGHRLFQEDFFGWKYGPVLKSVRSEYMKAQPFQDVEDCVCQKTKDLVVSVMDRYASLSSWRLSSLSHNEFSWKCSRRRLDATDNGDVKLELSAMKVDAARGDCN